MKNAGFNGYVYDFRVDYDAIAVDDISDIYKYLMKKNNIIWYMIQIKMFGFIKKVIFAGLSVLSYLNPLNTNQLVCVSMTKKERAASREWTYTLFLF